MEFDVDKYTQQELFEILGFNNPEQPPTIDDIHNTTQQFIQQFTDEQRPEMVTFFKRIRNKLKDIQTNAWFKHEALPQTKDPTQKDKVTDRVQKIDVFDNHHLPMNREQLGVNNNFQVPVAQDTLNPNLENITSHFINLDSQFRQASSTSATDYTMDLSDPLTNVLSLRLYSIQLPFTWYCFDNATYGNTCFWIHNAGNTFRISIEPGNYSPNELCNAIQTAFTNAGFTNSNSNSNVATFNPNNGKLTLTLTHWNDPNNQPIQTWTPTTPFDSQTHSYFIFFDVNGIYKCSDNGCQTQSQTTFNHTLGWFLGFRTPIEPILGTNGNQAPATLNVIGTKYFIVVLDDFNQNHINNGFITITELSKAIALPNYFNTSLPYICTENTLLQQTLPFDYNTVNANNTDSWFEKTDLSAGSVQQILPSAPRTLTQAQIYTVNEIMKNRSKTTNFRAKAPTNSDTFAVIPIKYGSMTTGQLYTELSGQFQDNKRIYFGPVNIDRLRIRLLDDCGNLVDLHGGDWCITLISENLYQY